MKKFKKADDYFLYFRSPFPSRAGFAAYRFPGLLVHVPVMVSCLFWGGFLSVSSAGFLFYPLCYLFVGLYAGRDLAILAHYHPLLTPLILAAAIVGAPSLNRANRLLLERALNDYLGIGFDLFPMAVTLAVLAFFALYIHRTVTRA
ncbi:MAG: hypothetical protein WAW37_12655 [Syntrophobacteraceae bacterium]